MAATLAIGSLLSALAPALKAMLAGEAINIARKYMFDGRTKGGKELNSQIYELLQNELSGMSPDDWGKILSQTNENAYKKKAGQWISELLPSAAGTALSTAGSAWNLKNSIMANAVSSALDSMVSPKYAQEWGNPYKVGSQLYTGAKLAQGGMANVIGGAAGNWLNNLSNQIKAENMQNRITNVMMNSNPSGEWYRTFRQYSRGSGASGGGQ